jgi:hypothetical protein
MNNLRPSLEELQIIDQHIVHYLTGVSELNQEEAHYSAQISLPAGKKFFRVSLIIDIFEYEIEFWIVDVSLIDEDEYLDAYNESTKNR